MKYNTFVFDLDGTLLDTLKDLQVSINHALTKYNYEIKTYEQVRSYLGNGISRLIELSIPNIKENKDFESIKKEFFAYYEKHLTDYTLPYDGTMDMLKKLKERKCTIAVVSNKADEFVNNLCKQFFSEYIDIAIGESEKIRRKPYSDMVDYALKSLSVSKENAVYVGDSEVDILTAENSGLDCISVSWGFREENFLKQNGASTIISTPLEILEYVK